MAQLLSTSVITTPLKVVSDTNVLLVSISSRSPYHPIFRSFIEDIYTLCVTTDVLDEYAEILSRRIGVNQASYVLESIDEFPDVLLVTRYYCWDLITAGLDDNKFVDGAVACNADYIVTNDGHFNALKAIPFPKVTIISTNEFLTLLSPAQL